MDARGIVTGADGAAVADRPHAARVLVFARAPVSGHCKTRLIPRLGASGAARLQARLLQQTLAIAAASGARLELWCTPNPCHGVFLAARRTFGLRLRRQPEGDLGLRMAWALRQALGQEQGPVILVGTDCPSLRTTDLQHAQAALRQDADVVLQPAADGGFVLIGARRLPPAALAAIDWSSGQELRQTCARLRRLQLVVRLLQPREDIDRPGDYRRARRAGLLPALPGARLSPC